MATKKLPFGFVIEGGALTGTLKHGFVISGTAHTKFEMREALVDDLLDAESEADVMKPLAFNAQLMLRQLVRVGTFEGPFTLNMLGKLKPVDWRMMRAAQAELDNMGEDEPADESRS